MSRSYVHMAIPHLLVFALGLLACLLPPDLHAQASESSGGSSRAPADDSHHWGMIDKYCSDCHNSAEWAGELAFDLLTDDIATEAKVWEKVVRKLRGRLMPPPGKRQPEKAAIDDFIGWMEGRLDTAAQDHRRPGFVGLHRMNRTEYANAIEDLLGLKVDPAALLPREVNSEGFDNVANALQASPAFVDQYVSAARDLSILAVGDSSPPVDSTTYRAAGDQTFHREGMPLGTRGGLLVEHYFPADGTYGFDINLPEEFDIQKYGIEFRHKVILAIDGVRLFETELGGTEELEAFDRDLGTTVASIRGRFQGIRLPVKAGAHRVAVTFVAKSLAESDQTLQPLNTPRGGMNEVPRVMSMDISGPYVATGTGQTASRQKIFVCRPSTAAEEIPCATRILSSVARRAFRRPVTDQDVRTLMRFYEDGRSARDFDLGIQQALMAILASPKFLYRALETPAGLKPGEVFPLGDYDLASRLSYFLWSRGPDEELLSLAGQGSLRQPGVLDQQVRRMLADPRAHSLVTNFAFKWLQADKIDEINPDPQLFPEFDETLREAFRKELALFVGNVLGADGSIVDLLNSDVSFVNERLAVHYGINNVKGDQFRKVTLDERRRGLLGKGALLMASSYANRTSPVLRGAWVLETLIGTPPAAPPPGVEALAESVAGARVQTVRQRLESHRANPSCNACHGVMDPLGFALENFDAIGRWRDKDRDAQAAIDAAGRLPDGTELSNPSDLRAALTRNPRQFAFAFTEKLLVFALGRTADFNDMPTIRSIVNAAGNDGYRFSSIVLGIVTSAPFQFAQVPEEEPPAMSAAAIDGRVLGKE